jgi:hypothetical protein
MRRFYDRIPLKEPSLAQRFVLAGASGLIAGKSLDGVGKALLGVLG